MYNCKNCGGNLRFDIPSQNLKCPNCDSEFDCYDVDQGYSEEDDDSYDVTVFSCPACGGEIISRDQSAAEFCTFCGSSVVLDAKLRREKRPKKIIPFQKTSDDCITAYKNKVKNSLFAPSSLKNAAFLKNFRGIYIPYWSYSFTHKGSISVPTSHSYSENGYDITDYYQARGDIDAHYDGIFHDASSSFDDVISEAVAPFDPGQMKDFVPSYLSGFYADTADVPADTYLEESNKMANDATLKVIQGNEITGKYPPSFPDNTTKLNECLHTTIAEPTPTMLPIWFSTWRDKDRVAYMTINGQTGKVAADIPIDIRKYWLATLFFAIPMYFVLNAVFSFTAPTTLFVASIFALVAGIIYFEEVSKILSRDTHKEDKGFLRVKTLRKEKKKSKNKKTPFFHKCIHFGMLVSPILYIICLFWNYMETEDIFACLFDGSSVNLFLIILLFFLWECILIDEPEILSVYKADRNIACSQITAILGCVINIIHPISDSIYYVTIMLVYLGIMITLLNVLQKYNQLITRPLPGFHDRGKTPKTASDGDATSGEDSASDGGSRKKLFLFAALFAALFLAFAPRYPNAETSIGSVTASASSDLVLADPETPDGGRIYTVYDSDYIIYINDQERLLSTEEEDELISYMMPITQYGNAAFVTTQFVGSHYKEAAGNLYYSLLGTESGVIFVIDMNNRQLVIHSDGDVYDVVNKGYANTITDNVYKLARKGDYFDCAKEAFSEIFTILSGNKIAEPMRHITNAMLALILSALILYFIVRTYSGQRAALTSEILTAIGSTCVFSNPDLVFAHQSKRKQTTSSSGGSSDHSSSSSSGGGHSGGGGHSSGGGGSHGF